MNSKDDYFDGDTNDLLLSKIAERDKVIELCYEALVGCEGALDECRDYPITYNDVITALAAVEQLKGKDKS